MKRAILLVVGALALAVGSAGCTVETDSGGPPPRPLPPPPPQALGVYEPCFDSFECGVDSEACFEIAIDHGSHIAVDGMCTLGCFDDFDCPFGGGCYAVQSQDFLCYQRCFDDFDCPQAFACVDTFGGARDAICLPF